jgi:hypothetical protein
MGKAVVYLGEVKMKRLLGFTLCMIFMSTSAYALSPPWYTVRSLLNGTVGASPCVEVGQVNVDQDPYTLDVTACSKKLASSLAVILRRDWSFGNVHLHVRVLDSTGQEVNPRIQPGPDPVATIKAQFEAALADNPLFSKIIENQSSSQDRNSFWVEIKKEVIQFFNDDLTDYYSNKNAVAENAFRHVCLSTFFKGSVVVGWTTAPDAP